MSGDCGPFVPTNANGPQAAAAIRSIAGGTTLATGPLVSFVNSNNISFGISGNTITASVVPDAGIGIAVPGTTLATGTAVLSNSNGISFGINGSTITATFTALKSLSAGTTNATGQGISFGNGSGVSFGVNGNTVTASVAAGATATGNLGALGAGTQTATSGTIVFANGSGVSFGMNGSTQITASVAAGATATGNLGALAAGSQTATSGTIIFANSNGVTFGMSGSSQVTASIDGIRSISAGTTRITSGEVVFANSNGISFGANGQTITASASTAFTIPEFENLTIFRAQLNIAPVTAILDRPYFVPFVLPASMTADRFVWQMSRLGPGSNSFAVDLAIYTMVNSTQMSLVGSVANTYIATLTANVSGIRQFRLTGLPAAVTTWQPGPYIVGMNIHSLGGGGTQFVAYSLMGHSANVISGVCDPGSDNNITATAGLSSIGPQFFGMWSTTSAGLPNSIGASDLARLNALGAAIGPMPIWFRLERS